MKLSIALLEEEFNEEFKNAIDSFIITRKKSYHNIGHGPTAKNCNSSIHHDEEGGNFKFRVIMKLSIALFKAEFNEEFKNAIDSLTWKTIDRKSYRFPG